MGEKKKRLTTFELLLGWWWQTFGYCLSIQSYFIGMRVRLYVRESVFLYPQKREQQCPQWELRDFMSIEYEWSSYWIFHHFFVLNNTCNWLKPFRFSTNKSIIRIVGRIFFSYHKVFVDNINFSWNVKLKRCKYLSILNENKVHTWWYYWFSVFVF